MYKRPIVIQGAMDIEVEYLKSKLENMEELTIHDYKFYKGYINNKIIVKDKKVIAEGNEILELDGDIIGRKSYVPVSDVIDRLDDCLKTVIDLLD